jgi:hypothetical protein
LTPIAEEAPLGISRIQGSIVQPAYDQVQFVALESRPQPRGDEPTAIQTPRAGGTARINNAPRLDAQLVGQAILQMANLPLEATVLFTTLLATKTPFVGRG